MEPIDVVHPAMSPEPGTGPAEPGTLLQPNDPWRAECALKQRWMRREAGAWAGLNELFRGGQPPDPPLQGDYAGELLATRTLAPLDALARVFDRKGLWWLGKSFDAEGAWGENRFDRRFRLVTRLLWPFYRDLRNDPPAGIRAFRFRTRAGAGVLDPDRTVLKIDYAAEALRLAGDRQVANPLAVRRVLDELVQVAPDAYVGKAHLLLPGGRWRTVAFFGLRREISADPAARSDRPTEAAGSDRRRR
jgi:hypothetical protein